MPTQAWAVAATVAASGVAALAAFLLKRGAGGTRLSWRDFRLPPQVVAAVILYLVSSLLFLAALTGAQLSLLVPLTALEYVWIVLLARTRLGERLGAAKALGIACIMLGVALVGLGS